MPSIRTAPWTCDSKVGRQPHRSRRSSTPGDGIFRSLLMVISHTEQVSARALTRKLLNAGRGNRQFTLIFRRLQLMQLDGCRRLFPLVLMVVRSSLEVADASEVVACKTPRSVERKMQYRTRYPQPNALTDMPFRYSRVRGTLPSPISAARNTK